MHLTRWPFQWPWICAGMEPSASTNALCSALQLKPLDTAIGRVFTPYRPGDRQGPIQTSKRTQSKDKTNTKTYIAQAKKNTNVLSFVLQEGTPSPKIDGHAASAPKDNYQVNNLHSL